MELIRHRPGPPLDRFIECFWFSQRQEPQDHGEHMLPSGAAQLLFALHENPLFCRPTRADPWIEWSGSLVHGPQSSFYLAGPKPPGSVVGVSFRAGGAGAVLGASMTDLTDRHVTLDAIWGRRGVDLHHRLISAAGPDEIFRMLEGALSARIHRPLLIHPAIAQALLARGDDAPSPERIAQLQRASGYSPRHFIALFRAAVGLNPKHYFRIRRFNAAVRRLAAKDGTALSGVAAAAGYSDQAHLSREFREFAGVAPTEYRAGGTDRPLHHRAATPPAAGGR